MVSLSRASWSSSFNSQHCTLVLSGPKSCPANNYLSSVSPYWGHRDSSRVELLFLHTAPIHLTISCSIPPSLLNKTPKYLNSYTSFRSSSPPFSCWGQDLEMLILILVSLHLGANGSNESWRLIESHHKPPNYTLQQPGWAWNFFPPLRTIHDLEAPTWIPEGHGWIPSPRPQSTWRLVVTQVWWDPLARWQF